MYKTLRESLISRIKSKPDANVDSIKDELDKIKLLKYINPLLSSREWDDNQNGIHEQVANQCIQYNKSKGKVIIDATETSSLLNGLNGTSSSFTGIRMDISGLVSDSELNINHIHFTNIIHKSAGEGFYLYNFNYRSFRVEFKINKEVTISGDNLFSINSVRDITGTGKLNLINCNLVGTHLMVPVDISQFNTSNFNSPYGLVLADNMILDEKTDNKIYKLYNISFKGYNPTMSYAPYFTNDFCFRELIKAMVKDHNIFIKEGIIINNMYSSTGNRKTLTFDKMEALGLTDEGEAGTKKLISKYRKHFDQYEVFHYPDIKDESPEKSTKKSKFDKYSAVVFRGPKIEKV